LSESVRGFSQLATDISHAPFIIIFLYQSKFYEFVIEVKGKAILVTGREGP
jgi:hypothetical protein